MKVSQIVSHEFQLGDKIAQAVSGERQTDFAFLLSLLSHDVMDMSQFRFNHVRHFNEAHLKSELEVPDSPPMTTNFTQKSLYRTSEVFHEGGLSAVRLHLALKPQPLTYDTDPPQAMLEVIHNTPPYCQLDEEDRYSLESIRDESYSNLILKQRLMESKLG